MKNYIFSILILSILSSASILFGCSSARDIEVSGQVQAESNGSTEPVRLEFFDITNEEGERESVHVTQLAQPGSFSETVALEGERVVIYALVDKDENGQCTAGEAWAEIEAEVTDDEVESVFLQLTAKPCPEVQ